MAYLDSQWVLPAMGLLILSLGAVVAAQDKEDDAWIAKIRRDHPRLFFNKDTWPKVKERALGPAKEYYEATNGVGILLWALLDLDAPEEYLAHAF